ncbi:MAG: aminotransferase class IV, partial [Flavobacteriaceae bacterium]|nr:aminotransferase class IV [Flavobacteriaceae bacterium]
MINFNGQITEPTAHSLSINNRGFAYGDALFETLKIAKGRVLYWEDHYFRLMASMRILRMEIPMNFTLEFLEEEILRTLNADKTGNTSARVKLTVMRQEGGLYDPESNAVDYLISIQPLPEVLYRINPDPCKVDLFKDFYIAPGLLSNLKTNNRILNVVGSIFAAENDFDNCLLLNTDKAVVEGLNA